MTIDNDKLKVHGSYNRARREMGIDKDDGVPAPFRAADQSMISRMFDEINKARQELGSALIHSFPQTIGACLDRAEQHIQNARKSDE